MFNPDHIGLFFWLFVVFTILGIAGWYWWMFHRAPLYGPDEQPIKPVGQPPLAVIVDTSAGMSEATLALINRELLELSKTRMGLILLCDCFVHHVMKLEDWAGFVGLDRGRGGTDMNPALHYVKYETEIREVRVYTDGFIPPIKADNLINVNVTWYVVDFSPTCDYGLPGTIIPIKSPPAPARPLATSWR